MVMRFGTVKSRLLIYQCSVQPSASASDSRHPLQGRGTVNVADSSRANGTVTVTLEEESFGLFSVIPSTPHGARRRKQPFVDRAQTWRSLLRSSLFAIQPAEERNHYQQKKCEPVGIADPSEIG